MNIYAVKASGTYGGGMAIVAAPDEATAKHIASVQISDPWHTRYDRPDSITRLPIEIDLDMAVVLEHFETGE